MELLERIEFWGLVAYVVASLAASALNGYIREETDGGRVVPLWVLRAASVINAVAANVDKSRQLWRGYRGPSAPQGRP